mmetsp:Transcript_3333/g.7114  ORF Transcript_3333/g.7114 Transcript_3333/m.7114 type:complete len:110 (-) Transcript_3333:12-341(-)
MPPRKRKAVQEPEEGAAEPEPKKQAARAKPKKEVAEAGPSTPPKAVLTSLPSTPQSQRRVDRSVQDGGDYQVYLDYTCKLMQTNIDGNANNNKFYIIQAAHSKRYLGLS